MPWLTIRLNSNIHFTRTSNSMYSNIQNNLHPLPSLQNDIMFSVHLFPEELLRSANFVFSSLVIYGCWGVAADTERPDLASQMLLLKGSWPVELACVNDSLSRPCASGGAGSGTFGGTESLILVSLLCPALPCSALGGSDSITDYSNYNLNGRKKKSLC